MINIPIELIVAIVSIVLLIITGFLIKYYVFPSLDIVGVSMQPTLIDGERKHSRRFFKGFDEPKIGKIYIYRDPTGRLVIKRLTMIQGDLCYFVGDNSSMSYDSRYYGFINKQRIVAVLME